MKARRLWTRPYVALILSNSLTTIAYSMFVGLLPLRLQSLGGSFLLAGLLSGVLIISRMISRMVVGTVIDRIPMRRLLLCSSAALAVNVAAYAVAVVPAMILFLQAVNGLLQGVYIITSSTLVAKVTPDNRLEDGIAYYRITSNIAVALGPAVGTWLFQSGGYGELFSGMTAVSVLAFVSLLLSPSAFAEGAQRPPEKRRFFFERAALAPAVLMALFCLVQGAPSNYLISHGTQRGISSISLFFTVNCVFMLLGRYIAKRISISQALLWAPAAGALLLSGAYLMISEAAALPLILLAGLCSGIGEGMALPTVNAAVFRMAPPGREGAANATFGIFTDIGTSLGAILWGGIYTSDNSGLIFQLAAGAAVCTALVSTLIFRRVRKE